MTKIRVLALGLLLSCVSCGDMDLFDFDKISDSIDWQPDITVGVGYGNFELWDLVNQYPEAGEDTIIYNENGKLFIRYVEKNIFNFNVSEVFELPDQNVEFEANVAIPPVAGNGLVPFPGMDDTYSLDQEIRFDNGESIDQMSASMRCTYILPKMPFKYSVKATFENISEGGRIVEINATSDKQVVQNRRELRTATIDMTGTPNTVKFKLQIIVEDGQMVDPGELTDLRIIFKLDNFSYQWVEGRIAPQLIEIARDKFKMDIDFWDKFDGDFNFADPKFYLVVADTSLGMKVQVDMQVKAYGNGKQESLVANPLEFDFTKIDGPLVSPMILTNGYDATNSNIAKLLSLPPKDYIEYSGQITVNPNGGKVFVASDASVSADVKVDIPFTLSATNLVFRDTIKDIDLKDADKIKLAQLMLEAENGIPLALEAGDLLLLDNRQECIDTVKVSKLLDAPEVDAAGNVIAPVKSNNKIDLSDKNIANLNRTKYIVIAVKAQTSNGGQVPTTLKPDAKLRLELTLRAKFDMNKL